MRTNELTNVESLTSHFESFGGPEVAHGMDTLVIDDRAKKLTIMVAATRFTPQKRSYCVYTPIESIAKDLEPLRSNVSVRWNYTVTL